MTLLKEGTGGDEPVPHGLPMPWEVTWSWGEIWKAWKPLSLWVKLLHSGSSETPLLPEEGEACGRAFPLTKTVSQRWLCCAF